MNATPSTVFEPREILRLVTVFWRRWLIPTIAVTLAAAAYAIVCPPTWQASQALIVRNEAGGGDNGAGRFRDMDEMKTVQETILELGKSRSVLWAALQQVGPAQSGPRESAWPTERALESLRQTAKIVPPKGVEFGTAEVFYLDAADKDRDRAVALDHAICEQLQLRFQAIRDAKAQSMIHELSKTVRMAQVDLQETSDRLNAVERQVGSDLAELRSLQDAGYSDSSLRRTVNEIESELRQARGTHKANLELLDLTRSAKADPGRLLAAPGRLLDAQPALRKLKEGLIEAQLRTAQLRGRMSPDHPLVIAAMATEEEVGRHLHDELDIAAGGLETELRLDADRTTMLEGQLAQATERLRRLAGLRTTYTNLVAANEHRKRLAERAEQNLAEARARAASAQAISLITPIDGPDAGTRPISPARSMILLGGLLGGLVTGLGVVLLTAPATALPASERIAVENPATIPTASPPAAEVTPAVASTASHGSLSIKQALKLVNRRADRYSAPSRP
jgi:uncharacterized protein involved in exopolysaccharide biosynthesis